MKKRIRTDEEQAFINVCEIAFDYCIADELSKEEIERYEKLCNETVMKRHRFRLPKDQTMTKEQAILYLKEVLYTWKNWKVYHKYLALALETLLEADDADVVEVKHGYWKDVKKHLVAGNPYQHTCGICGKSYFDHNIFNHPYCPNCGAKMDERKEK